MKKNQNQNFGWKLFILFFFTSLSCLFAQIPGPDKIHVGVQSSAYSISSYNPLNGANWTINSVNTNTVAQPNSGGVNIYLNPTFQEQWCTVILTATFLTQSLNIIQPSQTVRILPYISPTASVYVGQSTLFTIQDNCGCTGCTYNWNISPATLCASPCNLSGSTILVTCPPSGYPTAWSVDCIMTCPNGAYSFSSTPLIQRSSLIKLGPILSGITGYPDIGCAFAPPVTYPLTYSISALSGATYYNWIVPGFMSITQGQGTNIITVNANSPGIGVITVQAQAGGGSPVVSDIIEKNVQVCCTPVVPITQNVNSPNSDMQEAAVSINASNVVNSGATSIYHAGSYISLLPGFNAVNGSTVHAYIAGCSSGYYRTSNIYEEDNTGESSQAQMFQSSETNYVDRSQGKSTFYFSVVPNPSQGYFALSLNNTNGEEFSVLVSDLIGTKLIDNSGLTTSRVDLDLMSAPSGMYVVKIVHQGKAYFTKIIKN